jgi:hypothetical protein
MAAIVQFVDGVGRSDIDFLSIFRVLAVLALTQSTLPRPSHQSPCPHSSKLWRASRC